MEEVVLSKKIIELLDLIDREEMMHFDHVSDELWNAINHLYIELESADDGSKRAAMDYLSCKTDYMKPAKSVLYFSLIMNLTKSHDDVFSFLQYIRSNPYLSVNEKFFLHYQIKSVLFRTFKENSVIVFKENWLLFRDIVDEYRNLFAGKYDYIEEENRNRDFVVVLTGQILGIEHGPTKTVLDRCHTILKKLKKEIFLVNTAEVLSRVGQLPYVGCMEGNYRDEFSDVTCMEWRGHSIPFFQCYQETPNEESIDTIMGMINEKKPYFVINIGGSSVIASMVNMQVPVLSVGLGPSNLDIIETEYQTLGRKLNNDDREILRYVGKNESHVIEGEFTYTMVEQTTHLTKSDLKVPEESFVISVIGMRLDEEATDEFMQMLDKTIYGNMWVIFAGDFSAMDRVKKYSNLFSHFRFVGMQKDIQAFLDNCDLSVNPIRSGGGGGGGVEPMTKGIPVITTRYGDVYTLVGEDFAVEDYDEMSELMIKYHNDREFYSNKSKKAKARADILLDSDTAFIKTLEEMAKREGFSDN